MSQGLGSVHVAPDGQPVTLWETLPLNPFKTVTVTAEVPAAPCVSVNEEGLAAIAKSGGGVLAPAYTSTSVMALHWPPLDLVTDTRIFVVDSGANVN